MRKIILILCTHLISVCAMGQQAILLGNSVEIFATPNANTPLHALCVQGRNTDLPDGVFGESNSKYEYYCEAEIERIRNGRALVSISAIGTAPDDIDIAKCWVQLDNLGIILMNNKSITTSRPSFYVRFYDSPDKKASYRDLQPSVYVATITGMHNSWFQVVCIIKNEYVQGWIPQEEQCTNAFSLCMGN